MLSECIVFFFLLLFFNFSSLPFLSQPSTLDSEIYFGHSLKVPHHDLMPTGCVALVDSCIEKPSTLLSAKKKSVFNQSQRYPSHRGHVLEDGLAALGSGGKAERQMKRRLTVMYTSAAGHEESGIDMGGLFKDFWTDLSALAFDVNYGMFRQGTSLVIPAPCSTNFVFVCCMCWFVEEGGGRGSCQILFGRFIFVGKVCVC